MIAYHDDEWGVPQHDDLRLFEKISLEGAQAGLSWRTILRKREGYRAASPASTRRRSRASPTAKVERLLTDASIVRNRAKIKSIVDNAGAVRIEPSGEPGDGDFDEYLWSFVDGEPIVNRRKRLVGPRRAAPISRWR